LSEHGLTDEPVISESIACGADIVSFSGDKLLGAAQAGLVVGRRELVERLRRAPLYRALRADKLALAALEATLEAHRRGTAVEEIPALRMLALTRAQLEERARAFLYGLREHEALRGEIIEGRSAIGGGSAPTTHPCTALIALTHHTLSADALEDLLRHSSPPVIARIAEDKVLLDLRTVLEDEEALLLEILSLV
jgi:L-seryl-tRNA(Ser) seleniumtransferase